jgi:hypothetical protein
MSKELKKITSKTIKENIRINWNKEIKNRIKFGIPKELIWVHLNIRYCSIMFLRDFKDLFYHYLAFKNLKLIPGTVDFIKRENHKIAVKKYTEYVFKQIKDAGGALQLSKVCGFVHVIVEHNVQYKGLMIEIYYREKNASQSKKYPEKVLNLFKNNSTCRAVAFTYNVPICRKVLIEKNKKIN